MVENLTSVFSQLFTFVHMKWGKMKLKPVWMSYWSFWAKWNFRPAWNFHANNLPKAKWISSVMLDITFNTHVHLKQSFWQNEISFQMTKYMSALPEMKCPCISIKILVSFEIQPKWKVMWTELVYTLAWNLIPVWVHFASPVNIL